MKKRYLSAVLIAISVITLSACGNTKEPQLIEKSKESAAEVTEPSAEATVAATVEASESTEPEKEASTTALGDGLSEEERMAIYQGYLAGENIEDYDYYDYDNDGQKELIVFDMDQYYSMAAFEIEGGQPVVGVSGHGTAGRLSFHKVDGETWVCHADYEHQGRECYTFEKYEGAGNVVDSISFEAYAEDDIFDEDAEYYVNSEKVDRVTHNVARAKYLDTERYVSKDRVIWLAEGSDSFEWNGKIYTFSTEYDESDCGIWATISDGTDSLTSKFDVSMADNYVQNYVMIMEEKAYLYSFCFSETFGSWLYVYDLNKDSLKEPVYYDGGYSLENIRNKIYIPEAFSLQKISYMAGSGVVHKAFKVGSNGMPVPYDESSEDWYNDLFREYPIKVTAPVECDQLYLAPGAEDYEHTKVTLEPGTELYLYKTDDSTYVDFKDNDNITYRVYIPPTDLNECMENLPCGG